MKSLLPIAACLLALATTSSLVVAGSGRARRGTWLEVLPDGRRVRPDPHHHYDLLVDPAAPFDEPSSYTAKLFPMTADEDHDLHHHYHQRRRNLGAGGHYHRRQDELMHFDDFIPPEYKLGDHHRSSGKASGGGEQVQVRSFTRGLYLHRPHSYELDEPGVPGISDHGPEGWHGPKHYVYDD